MDSERSSMGESTRRRLAAAIKETQRSTHSTNRSTDGMRRNLPQTSLPTPYRIRRNSEGARNLWDTSAKLPSRQQHCKDRQQSAARPRSACLPRREKDFISGAAINVAARFPGESVKDKRGPVENHRSRDLITVASTVTYDKFDGAVEPHRLNDTMDQGPVFDQDEFHSALNVQRKNHNTNKSSTKGQERSAESLQKAVKKAFRKNHSLHMSAEDLLRKVLREVGCREESVSGDAFRKAVRRFDLKLSRQELARLIPAFGKGEILAFSDLCRHLFSDDLHDSPVHKGALSLEADREFRGKIVYPQCRSTVYTPSNWTTEDIKRSSLLPDIRLHLEFVYGYAGLRNTSQNLFVNEEGHLVYYTAGVGIVYQYSTETKQQWFFLGHNDDIACIALSCDPIDFKGHNYPKSSVAATGQVTSHTTGPYVCVWSTTPKGGEESLQEICRLDFEKSDRGIAAVAFSPCSRYLTTVAMDNAHTICVFDWRKQRVLFRDKAITGTPPLVFGIKFHASKSEYSQFVTFGKKHLKQWKEEEDEGGARRWKSTQLRFGKHPIQDIHSIEFLPSGNGKEGVIVAGMVAGDLYIIKDSQVVKTLPAHKPGSKMRGQDGRLCFGGVRGMYLMQEAGVLVTGGADGRLLFWNIQDGQPSNDKMAQQSIDLASEESYYEGHPAIRALTRHPKTGELIVGTVACDIILIKDAKKEVVMQGHASVLYFLCVHPLKSNIFATVCDSSWLFLFDAKQRDVVRAAEMGFCLRSIAFSNTPCSDSGHCLIAIGGSKGRLKVVCESDLRTVFTTRDARGSINDVKFSLNDRYLAVGSTDSLIDVYDITDGYKRVARCHGHSASIKQLDWSRDGLILQSTCAAYELLYWNPRTGKQEKECQKDTEWATWTSILGFPVMGIWSDVSDGSDINACHRSHDGKLVVTSGDDGLVKMYKYPCVLIDAPYRAYRGHSSHVMCVRFSCNDRRVYSAGGKDRAVFQFACKQDTC